MYPYQIEIAPSLETEFISIKLKIDDRTFFLNPHQADFISYQLNEALKVIDHLIEMEN